MKGQRGTIGFERVVRVTAHAKSVQVADQQIPVVDPNNPKSLTARVLTAIDDQAKTWGEPSNGFYWVPLIKFVVTPQGDQVYRRVASPLRALGLTVETVSQHSNRGVR